MIPTLLFPDWPAAKSVTAAVSTRQGGSSIGPFSSFNLSFHVHDDPEKVANNRKLFQQALPGQPSIQWLNQVHGIEVKAIESSHSSTEPVQADALYTRRTGIALAVMTADCLPVCFSTVDGSEIAIAHAGWKGLAAGVVESTLQQFSQPLENIIVWLGPAIGPCHFEVGSEVKAAFFENSHNDDHSSMSAAFTPSVNAGYWMADLYSLARKRLKIAGVCAVYGGGYCTICQNEQFFSYRKEAKTGRFASVIYRR